MFSDTLDRSSDTSSNSSLLIFIAVIYWTVTNSTVLSIQIRIRIQLTLPFALVFSDCFERVALEAMLPFEKTFLTVDINSLRICKEKCIQEGDKCQTISFGHVLHKYHNWMQVTQLHLIPKNSIYHHLTLPRRSQASVGVLEARSAIEDRVKQIY